MDEEDRERTIKRMSEMVYEAHKRSARAVAAIDASIQFAPKNCREAMLLAREALTGESVESAVRRPLHEPYYLSEDSRVICSCGTRAPMDVDADAWVAAHIAESRGV